ncbi:transposase [Acetomicrobium sp. S15 = DSM 107314]|uniref:transposase n=1 Tax=Acetomicrobium sp. S15 = DSM 107314 TaxID=2529858 RepID=UPI0018E1B1C4|nr:transposase [Acetomicrobium sp. S15 = DSM 107314]
MKQRKWTAEEKFAIVIEGLKGQKTVSEICRDHALSQTVYYKWRDAFLEGGKMPWQGEARLAIKLLLLKISEIAKDHQKTGHTDRDIKKTEELSTTR